jgi:hypothetical protein
MATQPFVADIDEDAVEPGPEALGISQPRPAPPGEQQGLLRRILGLGRVTQEVRGEAV